MTQSMRGEVLHQIGNTTLAALDLAFTTMMEWLDGDEHTGKGVHVRVSLFGPQPAVSPVAFWEHPLHSVWIGGDANTSPQSSYVANTAEKIGRMMFENTARGHTSGFQSYTKDINWPGAVCTRLGNVNELETWIAVAVSGVPWQGDEAMATEVIHTGVLPFFGLDLDILRRNLAYSRNKVYQGSLLE